VDERVYQVLSQRCDLFQSYVGAMQPVLSIARRMLLGVQPFDAAALDIEADSASTDALAGAAFEGTIESPPPGKPPGVTIDDLGRAFGMLKLGPELEASGHRRPVVATSGELDEHPLALALSPFTAELRHLGHDFLQAGDRAPLVLGVAEDGAFRVVVAVWVGADGHEIVERAERLEALMGMWNGASVTEAAWKEAHALARSCAEGRLTEMRSAAMVAERAALERQVGAARDRLLRELARFLACSATDSEDFNAAFHRSMQRGGQVGALLARAHGLVRYPQWPEDLVEQSLAAADALSANQRTNVLLGTPLEAAVRDPRWAAAATLQVRTSESPTSVG
jgi:hypothetical protein